MDVLSAWNFDTSPQSVPRISRRSCVTDAESQDTWLQGVVSHISAYLACEATGKPHGHRSGDVTCADLGIARGNLGHRQKRNG